MAGKEREELLQPQERQSGAARDEKREPEIRHTIMAQAPIDGDYKFGSVIVPHPDGNGRMVDAGVDPDWEYAALSDADLPTFSARGYLPVRFSKTSARFAHDPRAEGYADDPYKDGAVQRMGGCTLMKVQRTHIEARRADERSLWDKKKYGNDQVAVLSGGMANHGVKEIPVGG